MSDDHPHSSYDSTKKSWVSRLIQLFQDEPKNRDELFEVIHDAEERDLIDQDTKDMIEGVLEVSELRVRDIMIPRSQMVTIDITQTVHQFLPIVIESAHSRFPVINEDKDHIEGILLAKDMLQYGFDADLHCSIDKILRPAVIVPESKRIDKLLKEFREKRYHMAIVVDEFGGVSGLVTIEDILEQIVGEIEDEYDDADDNTAEIRPISKQLYAVGALTPIDNFNDMFGTHFSDEEVDTMGGLVVQAFGHLPKRGEVVELEGYQFKITHADRRRLLQLQVKTPEQQTEQQADH
ncbi:CNNM family magnesium/cobalt transport protein CorC [Dongshaea marina]|uniref:CNNM family magnesium/cobalt transport protein CorC n=1 Tax=Dongshaea marina TaxID=2047966 RepID=UPI000D3EC8F9|nr:CNNM family magnesium/cobalt transport protein CorC [Dongshaea marina]